MVHHRRGGGYQVNSTRVDIFATFPPYCQISPVCLIPSLGQTIDWSVIRTLGGGLVSYFVPDKANKGASCINLEKLNCKINFKI